MFLFLFFFTNTATAEIYTLSLHDALPIWREDQAHRGRDVVGPAAWAQHDAGEGSCRAQYAPPVQEGPRPEARERGDRVSVVHWESDLIRERSRRILGLARQGLTKSRKVTREARTRLRSHLAR